MYHKTAQTWHRARIHAHTYSYTGSKDHFTHTGEDPSHQEKLQSPIQQEQDNHPKYIFVHDWVCASIRLLTDRFRVSYNEQILTSKLLSMQLKTNITHMSRLVTFHTPDFRLQAIVNPFQSKIQSIQFKAENTLDRYVDGIYKIQLISMAQ